MNRIDILEMKINIAEQKIPDNSLIQKIIFDELLQKMNCYGLDILFIIERCNTPITSNIDEKKLYNYINDLINKIAELSENQYSENELLLFKKYIFYKLATTYLDMAEKREQFIKDIENVITIPTAPDTAIWYAKENLRLILLDLYTSFGLFDIDRAKELLEIVKANNTKRQRFVIDVLNQVFMS